MITIAKPVIGQEEVDAVSEVIRSGLLVQGKHVALLEKRFSELCQTKFAIATNNGTSALHTALYSIGIQPDDEVITTPFTFIATVNSILMAGARPVFVDIDERTFNVDSSKIQKAITKKTKAILSVNLYGQPADYTEINRVAKRNNLLVIEDAAQSIHATYKNKKSGNLADISCFSLYATKNITSGEGGMITTNNKTYYERATLFRQHGQSDKARYEYIDIGYNYRLTDIAAAIAYVQCARLDSVTKRRQEIAEKYNRLLQHLKGIQLPFVSAERESVYHQYTVRVTNDANISRDQLKDALEKKGIQAIVYYPKPLHTVQHIRQHMRYNSGRFPKAEQAAKEVLSIPVHPLLTELEIEFIIEIIKKAVQ